MDRLWIVNVKALNRSPPKGLGTLSSGVEEDLVCELNRKMKQI
jgi:hypothetical protein